MKKLITICLTLSCLLWSCGSGQAKMGGMVNASVKETREKEEHNLLVEGDSYPFLLTDYMNHEFTIKEKPENYAVMSGTFLNLWYRLGGKSVCSTDVDSAMLDEAYRDEILSLPSAGAVYNTNVEKVAEIDPDFVIAQMGVQSGLASGLEKIEKETALFHMRSYSDVIDHIRAFGKILDNQEEAEKIISEMDSKKEVITSKLPDTPKSVVILYVTSASLSVKLDNSIAGDVAAILEMKNIASDLMPDTIGSETTPLDVEYIAEKNPDMILVTSMISSNEAAKKTMQEQFDSNPVWQTIDAVQENRVLYLPQEYFLYNAGHKYVDAIEYMAKGVYPQIYGELDE
ncbi:ABC transporter substrate-binding protein [Acidaminobacter sp. JC074]|uniref:ABC transporter substrate-binding protein n=1 Tax=Acidaminobacter sp. JC074 TaxID=2530199 RepID=UPI001F0E523C|nr:ABC transporter substrate-binding protein [Acidaminobacter sp. JC074]MCH4886559.1 ABC transporter substrate-binding protein [Acidaminobacter sp. JC074]